MQFLPNPPQHGLQGRAIVQGRDQLREQPAQPRCAPCSSPPCRPATGPPSGATNAAPASPTVWPAPRTAPGRRARHRERAQSAQALPQLEQELDLPTRPVQHPGLVERQLLGRQVGGQHRPAARPPAVGRHHLRGPCLRARCASFRPAAFAARLRDNAPPLGRHANASSRPSRTHTSTASPTCRSRNAAIDSAGRSPSRSVTPLGSRPTQCTPIPTSRAAMSRSKKPDQLQPQRAGRQRRQPPAARRHVGLPARQKSRSVTKPSLRSHALCPPSRAARSRPSASSPPQPG